MAQQTHLSIPRQIPAGASEDGSGILLGSGPATVELFEDFMCPFCRQFEEASGAALEALVSQGAATLAYHPLGFLDRLSSTRYSTRAAAASGCAADQGAFMDYKNALFANQPEEGGPGLSDEELVAIGSGIGLEAGFEGCIDDGLYREWAAYVTAQAIERGVGGTPSVFVEGHPVPANARAIAAAVQAIVA